MEDQYIITHIFRRTPTTRSAGKVPFVVKDSKDFFSISGTRIQKHELDALVVGGKVFELPPNNKVIHNPECVVWLDRIGKYWLNNDTADFCPAQGGIIIGECMPYSSEQSKILYRRDCIATLVERTRMWCARHDWKPGETRVEEESVSWLYGKGSEWIVQTAAHQGVPNEVLTLGSIEFDNGFPCMRIKAHKELFVNAQELPALFTKYCLKNPRARIEEL